MSLAIIAMWVLVPALRSSGQWGDHFEQFVWAHSLQWGYHKHPPLPTWLLGGLIAAFGPSPWWTYALAAACTSGTAFFTYRVAQRLLPQPLAALAILLWGLQQAFSTRAQLYNHNTVMMVAVSATVWAVQHALASRGLRWWWVAGAAAGLAMLSKYQAVVPLAGIVLAMMLTGEITRRDVRRGLPHAFSVAALIFAPHLAWMVGHDFSTLRYASQHGHALGWNARGLSVVGFLAQQVRLLFPALLFSAALWCLPGIRATGAARPRPDASHARPADPVATAPGVADQSDARHPVGPRPDASTDDTGDRTVRYRREWFSALIAFPLVVTLATCPAFGLALENHWGFQALQFVGLWLAWQLRAVAQRPTVVIVALAFGLQLASLAVLTGSDALKGHDSTRRDDNLYPARALAQAARRDWSALTACPLRLVVGPSFEAGMISVYGHGDTPAVLEEGNFDKSPWIARDAVERSGAIFVAATAEALPKEAAHVESMRLLVRNGVDQPSEARVYWAIVPPRNCEPDTASP